MSKDNKYTFNNLPTYITLGATGIYEIAMLYVAFLLMIIVNFVISLAVFGLFYYLNFIKLGSVVSVLIFLFIFFATLIQFLPKAGYVLEKKATITAFIVTLLTLAIFLLFFYFLINF